MTKAEEKIRKKLGRFEDCLMPIEEYKEYVADGYLTSWDGFGEYYNIDGEIIGDSGFSKDEIERAESEGAVFVAWYNK